MKLLVIILGAVLISQTVLISMISNRETKVIETTDARLEATETINDYLICLNSDLTGLPMNKEVVYDYCLKYLSDYVLGK